MSNMERRLLVVLAAVAVAVVVVGLSAAATMTRNDSAQPTTELQRVKASKKVAKKVAQRAASKRKADVEATVVVSSGRAQSSEEVEQYWTNERMADAQPMEKTRVGPSGGRPSSPAPAPSGVTAPGRAPTKAAPAKKPSPKPAQSADDTGVATSPTVSNPNYWTDEKMADAQPMDNTRPGGSGSQSDPGSGGTTMPGSPPP